MFDKLAEFILFLLGVSMFASYAVAGWLILLDAINPTFEEVIASFVIWFIVFWFAAASMSKEAP